MKKIAFFVLGCLMFGGVFAVDNLGYLGEIDGEFVPECYEYVNVLEKSDLGYDEGEHNVYKVGLNNIYDMVIVQGSYLMPYKFFGISLEDSYRFSDNVGLAGNEIMDYNHNTYKEINSNTQGEIVISFDEVVEKNNFSFEFNYTSKNYYPEYYISQNKSSWDKIKKEDIEDFDFKYLKIDFVSRSTDNYLEMIKIYEMSFYKKSKTILVKSYMDEDITIYSKNNCSTKKTYKRSNFNDFIIDKDTKFLDIDLKKNPNYNVYTILDIDKDGVADDVDNCKNIFNPYQLDSDSNGVGDECSDIDKDGIIGNIDNCKTIYNPDQKDINRNNVGDKCEFDKDEDGIFDQLDNCITVKNVNQNDIDGDQIGDACDNCKLYNPRQLDIDNSGLGDVCEEAEKRLLENDLDGDNVKNNIDNCKTVANSDQKDSDKDGIGDVCDNCMDIQNEVQLDFDKNGVGDMCEDSDDDGIMGYLDNCVTISNKDQKDSDNDGIGNVCEDDDRDSIIFSLDNCPNDFNPDQNDIDKDNIGDKCDTEDGRYIESNKGFFIGLLLFITLMFGAGIFFMMKKLK